MNSKSFFLAVYQVILIYTFSFLAINSAESDPSDCDINPSKEGCPENLLDRTVNEKLDSLCKSMPDMPTCTLRDQCNNNKQITSNYCKPYSLYGDICVKDGMSSMNECKNYTKICDNSNSKYCLTQPFEELPTSKQTVDNIKSICNEMPMEGCDSCLKDNKCDISLYSNLCLQMPGMTQCNSFDSMCSKINNEIDICKLNSNGSGKLMPAMKMYFHTGITDYILFKNWVPQSAAGYFGSFVAIVLIGVFYEFLIVVRSRLERTWSSHSTDEICKYGFTQFRIDTLRSVLRFVEVGISYLLMLIAMTFNVGLFFAVLIGLALGTFAFSRFGVYTTSINSGCGC